MCAQSPSRVHLVAGCRPMDFNIFTTALTSKHSAIQRRCEKKNGEGIKSNKPDSTANVKLPLMNVKNYYYFLLCENAHVDVRLIG